MDIDFIPVFNITITPDEVVAYYDKIGITDYPKNEDGPIMKQNKTVVKILYNEKKQYRISEYKELIEQRRKEKALEACVFRIDTSRNEDCPICFESMAGRSILDCSHVFCIKCSIQHFRLHQNCPLCRAEVCKPPTKSVRITIPDENINQIVEDNLGYIYPERNDYDLYNFILINATLFKESTSSNACDFASEIYEEVSKFGFDVANDVKDWYSN